MSKILNSKLQYPKCHESGHFVTDKNEQYIHIFYASSLGQTFTVEFRRRDDVCLSSCLTLPSVTTFFLQTQDNMDGSGQFASGPQR